MLQAVLDLLRTIINSVISMLCWTYPFVQKAQFLSGIPWLVCESLYITLYFRHILNLAKLSVSDIFRRFLRKKKKKSPYQFHIESPSWRHKLLQTTDYPMGDNLNEPFFGSVKMVKAQSFFSANLTTTSLIFFKGFLHHCSKLFTVLQFAL